MIYYTLTVTLAVTAAVFAVLWLKERKRADVDTLTGLYGRFAFTREFEHMYGRIKRALDRSVPVHSDLAIMYMDVHEFKHFNDTHGHREGDRVLKQIAKKLQGLFKRDTDNVGRLHGDEFVVVFEVFGTEEEIEREVKHREEVLHNMLKEQELPVDIGTERCHLNTDSERTPRSIDEVIHLADQRMYAAKKGGR